MNLLRANIALPFFPELLSLLLLSVGCWDMPKRDAWIWYIQVQYKKVCTDTPSLRPASLLINRDRRVAEAVQDIAES